jgi:hypothetical protein
MRNLLFKNLTSDDKRRKIIASSEIVDKQGVHSVIHRHFVCYVKEVINNTPKQPAPYVYVLKEHDNQKHKSKFFCKVKGSIYAAHSNRLFLIVFMHTLKINLAAIRQDLTKHS